MYARSQDDSCRQNNLSLHASDVSEASRGTFVKRLSLTGFRNYASLRMDLPPNSSCVVLTGPNGIGKTNLIEAVSFLAPGKGMRQSRFADILPKESDISAWAISAVLKRHDEEISVGTGYDGAAKISSDKRQIRINGVVRKSQADLGEVCSAIWLTPAMDRLFSGDPAGRRRFWDRLTQAFFPAHGGHCAAYSQALRQWGGLIREGKTDEVWLAALEKTLGKYGARISLARRETLTLLQDELENELTCFPRALLSLCGGLEEELAEKAEGEASVFITEQFGRSREVYAQSGSAGGIHTVDLAARHREKDMRASGCSTGEQKALLISVLIAHIRAQERRTGTLPLVLFDEVTAHLDEKRRLALFEEVLSLRTQVWLTGTDNQVFDELQPSASFIAVNELLREQPILAAAS